MKKSLILVSLTLVLAMGACKPTEKGYKSAYDAALGKREAALADMNVDLPEGALQKVDGPQLKEINGVSVYVMNERIKPVEQDFTAPGDYNVAIATYKMITNCRSQVEDLKKENYDAFAAKDEEGMYFTIAGSFPTVEEAVNFYENYRKKKDRVYVGLPNSPVIIYSPR